MPLRLGYLLDIFSMQIMVSMVPKGTFFFFLFGTFPHCWLGNYIWGNLGLDYKIDVGSVFCLYYTVIILCSLHDRIYWGILEINPLAISLMRPLNLMQKKHVGKRNHWDGNSKCLVTVDISEKPFCVHFELPKPK